MNKKTRILSAILAVILLFGMIPNIPSYAYTNVSSTLPFTFVKTGRVVTLIKDYEDYYIMRENFAADGSYVENVIMQSITATQYESELAKKDWDVHKINELSSTFNGRMINDGGGRVYFINYIEGSNGNTTASFIGNIASGYNNSTTLLAMGQSFGNPYSFLFDNNGRYFRGTTNIITGITTLVPLEQNAFELLKLTMSVENLSFLRVVKYSNDSDGKAHYSDIIYNQDATTELTAFVKDAVEIDATLQDIANGETFKDESQGADKEALDGYDASRYGEAFQDWEDAFNKGFMGAWQDPSYMGKMELIEWTDPFWKNSDITSGDTISVGGYYDDVGNWIATDASGNPIPKIPGQFDAAGNFMPTGLNGYYDPDGIYHPMFAVDNDISILNGNIYIDDEEYYDRYGTWHQENKTLDNIYLYNGSHIGPTGNYYDSTNTLIDTLKVDMWGKYKFGAWIIYPDGTIFDTSLNKIILNDGTEYVAELTENGSFFFENGMMIMPNTFAKGTKKGDNALSLTVGGMIYETDIIEYANGIVYNSGSVILPNKETITEKFRNGYIDLGDYGRIYENGHYAEYNDFGNLVTDIDSIIFEDGSIMLENGYIWTSDELVIPTYMDGNLNIVSRAGAVYNRKLEKSMYNELGELVPFSSVDMGYYDRLGNKINPNGTVIHGEIVGYYDSTGTFVPGESVIENGYYTCDGYFFSIDGSLTRKAPVFGYTDAEGYYTLYNKSGKYDSTGTYYAYEPTLNFHINENGNLVTNNYSDFILNMDGSISLLGESSTYAGNGLFNVKKNTGYYDEIGRFIIAKINPYIASSGGFYDSSQTFHKESEVYIDANGNWKLLYNPKLGIVVKDGLIGFTYTAQTFSPDGITSIEGKTGYYNANGEFIVSTTNPFLGGFFNSVGTWIDRTYYTDSFGNLCENNGNYIYNGNYITPSGDIGYFNESGIFVLNKINPFVEGFYDASGEYYNNSYVFRDALGLYKGYGTKFIYTPEGNSIPISEKNVEVDGYKVIYLGIFADKDGNLGVFDRNGNFLANKNSYDSGVYLPGGVFVDFTKDSVSAGNMIFHGQDYILVNTDDSNAILYFYDGYSIDLEKIGNYYSARGAYFSSDMKYSTIIEDEAVPYNEAVLSMGLWLNDEYYADPKDSSGYFGKDGTFYQYAGGFGYYNGDGEYISGFTCPYINGFYISDKRWVGPDEPSNAGYFNKYGVPRNGKQPETSGYFDHEGTWHESGQNLFVDINGNAHLLNTNAVGYKDVNGRIHLYNVDGYFDTDGTYIVDNTIMGYYDKDGKLKAGRNPSFEGFYDMNKRWYQFTDNGYFDESGKYYDTINGELIGYYNSVGEFTEGWNPYFNGYYGFNGDWSSNRQTPVSIYFDSQGVKHIGKAPYFNGFYDKNGSWYFRGDKGFYDKNGTFCNITTSEIGYYDKLGIYYEGTNPYQHGYYDPDKNLHLFGQEGYYSPTGTYVDVNGNNHYYLTGGLRREGINPNNDGFFDVRGNWHEFGEDGYYDSDGIFHDYLLIVSSFKVGSPDYILFEGIFNSSEYVSSQIKNTVQFSIFKDGLNTRFLDTGIRVPANAMVTYDKAADILHAISIYRDGTFIQDANSCMLIYEGSIINLINTGKISVKQLKDKFVDSDIDIVVARSRIGERYALAEAIETKQDIKVYNDGDRMILTKPMVVNSGIPYVAINDFKNIMGYDVKASDTKDGILLSFTRKDTTLNVDSSYPESVTTIVGSSSITVGIAGTYTTIATEKPFISIKLEGEKNSTIYMPASYISPLTGKDVALNTLTFELLLTSHRIETPIEDN